MASHLLALTHRNFMFCRPCISIYSWKGKPTWCTTYS